MMEEIKENLDKGLAEMVNDKDYPNFSKIEANNDYTEFEVTIRSKEAGIVESFSVLAFYMYGGMYNAFNGTPIDNVCVKFINEESGEVIEEANSRDMGANNDTSPSNNSVIKKMDGSGDLGNSYVEIKRANLVQERDGDAFIVVTYAWTNNGEKTSNAMNSLYEQAFQNGVELDSFYLSGYDEFDFNSDSRDVKPGATTDVQCAFKLTSDTATVEFEITDWPGPTAMVTMDFNPQNLG